jgi:SAM-dependent methyltransferase
MLDVGCGEMPYRELILTESAGVKNYQGMDLPVSPGAAVSPDLVWDGNKIPMDDASVDCVMLTEVLEHCPEPENVLREVSRVLRPNGFLFLTVPFFLAISLCSSRRVPLHALLTATIFR